MPPRLLSLFLRRVMWVCFATLAASPPPRAQVTSASNPNRTVNLNYVYAADLGIGGYSLGGLNADVYTLPLAYALPDVPRNEWILQLLAPVQGGFYSFGATDTNGQHLSIKQQSLSVVPGAELQIPVGERVVLKPFAQLGVVHVYEGGDSNPDALVYLAGVRTVAQWHSGAYTYSIGNGVIFAGDKTLGHGFSERYVALQIGGEIRRPLDFKIGEWAPDLGLYAGTYYYPEPLVFSRFLRSPLQVANQGEIAFSIGSATPSHILWLSNPRIGVGYVFGSGLNVWHANFGFPF